MSVILRLILALAGWTQLLTILEIGRYQLIVAKPTGSEHKPIYIGYPPSKYYTKGHFQGLTSDVFT